MTPNLTTRNFTNDQLFVDNIFYQNSYKLKSQKDNPKTIVDIGAHIGAFSLTALLLGAKKVYAFEPHIDSFSILFKNVYNEHFSGRITPYNCGVNINNTIQGFSTPDLVDRIYFDFGAIGFVNSFKENYYPVHCISLDNLLEIFCYGELIDILKINIGYMEREILITSTLLVPKVNAICGEVELTEEEIPNFKKQLGVGGFIHWFNSPINAAGRIQFWASKSALSEDFTIKV